MVRMNFGKAALAAMVGAALAVPAYAYMQRDPAYEAARANGQVGEQMDGYLGVVGSQPEAIRDLVRDINIKRRANFTQRAQAQNATIQEYAFAQACLLIERTTPGEKYQAPDGTWQTRTSAPPQKHPNCP